MSLKKCKELQEAKQQEFDAQDDARKKEKEANEKQYQKKLQILKCLS